MEHSEACAVLGVGPDASPWLVRSRYRQLAKAWHPDKWVNDPAKQAAAAERMRQINEAVRTLRAAALRPHRLSTVVAANAAVTVPAWRNQDTWLDKGVRLGCGGALGFVLALELLAPQWLLPTALLCGVLAVVLKDRFFRASEKCLWWVSWLWL